MKVFLGGTCNESRWRNLIIPMLDIEYFNPVVADWTPACMAEELRQRVVCELCLYVVTPKMAGVYSIAEVVDDSNKQPHNTVFVRLRDDGDNRFDDGQWKSLGAVAEMVERNGAMVFDNLKSASIYLNKVKQKEKNKMEAYQERVVEEKRELDEKLAKLLAFIDTERFAALSVEEQMRMNIQRSIMACYNQVLGQRIEAF